MEASREKSSQLSAKQKLEMLLLVAFLLIVQPDPFTHSGYHEFGRPGARIVVTVGGLWNKLFGTPEYGTSIGIYADPEYVNGGYGVGKVIDAGSHYGTVITDNISGDHFVIPTPHSLPQIITPILP